MPLAVQIALYVGAVGALVGGMYYSLTYTFPDGKQLDIGGFVALWLREIIILTIPVIGLVVAIAGWLIRRFRAQDKNAL